MPTEKTNFSLIKNVLLALLVSATWLLFIRWPRSVSIKLDESWAQVLGWAIQNQQQAGVDYVWTYGPFGYFANEYSTFQPELFFPFVIWWITVATAICILLFIYSWQKPFIFKLSLWLISALFIAPSSDAPHFFIIVLASFLLIDPPTYLQSLKRYITLYLIISILLTCISLTKFTFFILAIFCLILVWIKLYSLYSIKGLVTAIITNTILFSSFWLLTGQSLSNIPDFIYYALQLSSGYSWSMSGGEHPINNLFAAVNLSVILLLLIASTWQGRQQLTIWLKTGILLLMLFMIWKVGFVRHNVHVFIFFSVVLIFPFIIELKLIRRYQQGLFYSLLLINTGVALSAYALAMPVFFQSPPSQILKNAKHALLTNIVRLQYLPSTYRVANRQLAQQKTAYQLPQIKKIVAAHSIDIFQPNQALMFLNDLNYQPRPVFQGYSVYTSALQTLNKDFFHSARAPEYLIFGLESVLDSRLPSSEDAAVFNQALWQYQPRLMENNYLLLQRKAKATTVTQQPILARTLMYGEWLTVSDWNQALLMAEVTIQPSILGKMGTFLYRAPIVVLELRSNDGNAAVYRLLPSLQPQRFLLNPIVLNTNDFLQLQQGNTEALSKVVQMRVNFLYAESASWFTQTYQLRLQHVSVAEQGQPIAAELMETQATPSTPTL